MKRNRKLVGIKTENCRRCGKPFEFKTGRGVNFRFCSEECRHDHKRELANKKAVERRKLTRTWDAPRQCPVCLDTFYPNHFAQKFCCKKCSNAYHKGPEALLRRRERVRKMMERNIAVENGKTRENYTIKRSYASLEKSDRMASEYGFNYGDIQKAKTLALIGGSNGQRSGCQEIEGGEKSMV